MAAENNQLFTQDSPGIPGAPATDDDFGEFLATTDIEGDGTLDLLVGVPDEYVDQVWTGAAFVLPGTSAGLTGTGATIWSQGTPGVRGDPESGDQLGESVTGGDYDGDGLGDVAIGVLRDTVFGRDALQRYAGAVNVLRSDGTNLQARGSKRWHQGSAGVLERPAPFDEFGAALS